MTVETKSMRKHEKEYWIKQLKEVIEEAHLDGYYFILETKYDDRIREWTTIYTDDPELDIDVGKIQGA
jgi:hypothetical protein